MGWSPNCCVIVGTHTWVRDGHGQNASLLNSHVNMIQELFRTLLESLGFWWAFGEFSGLLDVFSNIRSPKMAMVSFRFPFNHQATGVQHFVQTLNPECLGPSFCPAGSFVSRDARNLEATTPRWRLAQARARGSWRCNSSRSAGSARGRCMMEGPPEAVCGELNT